MAAHFGRAKPSPRSPVNGGKATLGQLDARLLAVAAE